MSIKINMITAQKKHMAEILKAIAEDIAMSTNDTVTVTFELTYNTKKDC